MSYVLKIGSKAEDQLAAQPEPLRSFIHRSLRRLAESPSAMRSRPKRIASGQVAEFRFDDEPRVSVWVSVEFRYGSDEETLHIEGIQVEFGA